MNNITKLIITAFCITVIFTQCYEYTPQRAYESGVYIAGAIKEEGNSYPAIWINSYLHNLEVQTANKSEATCIDISGINLYVGGYISFKNSDKQAVYWRNDTLERVDVQNNYSMLYDIAVIGKDIYLFGCYGTNGNNTKLCYWKNGVRKDLTDVGFWIGGRMHVVNGDVYTCGTLHNGLSRTGIAFKNATSILLEDKAEMKDIIFANGVVNVAGSDLSSGVSRPAVWKNTTRNILPLSGTSGTAQSITVVGTDVYVGGKDIKSNGTIPTIWKNGVAKIITGTDKYGDVNCVKVAGTDVHACGKFAPKNGPVGCHYFNYAANSLDPKACADSSITNDIVIKP
jgi:hypothetical protein